MIRLSRILKDYQESGALNALVNVHAAIDDHTFLTKGGDLLVVLKAEGVDYECLEPLPLDQITRRFGGALRLFDERFRLYQYLLKRNRPEIPHGEYPNPVVQRAALDRIRYLETKADGLYHLDIYFVVAYEPARPAVSLASRLAATLADPRRSLGAMFSNDKKIAALEGDLDRACEMLANKVNSFVLQLRDSVKVEVLDKHAAFAFFRQLLNYAPYKADAAGLGYDTFVDFQACDSSLECHRDHLLLDNEYVQVLTLKTPPAQTSAHLLRSLQEIPAQLIVATEWKRRDNAAMRRMIQSKRRHFHNSKVSLVNYLNTSGNAPKDVLTDEGAAAVVAELGSCLEELEVKGNYFGEFSMTVIVHDEDRTRLRRAVAECFKACGAFDAQLMEERYNLLNAFLAVLPGNHVFNLRRLWLSNMNYADLSLLFALSSGEVRNPHLGAEYLAVLETNHRSPYYLNLHYGDTALSLVLGATGSGKSFFLNFLLTHMQKYAPRTTIFDLGASYQSLTELFGGSYLTVGGEGRSFTINPFCLPPTPENLQFLFSFLRVLVESSGYSLSASDERDLFEQIGNLYAVEPDQRRLLTLANILNRALRQALQKWVQGGQYGALFDNIEDNLTFARFQAFDFEGMDKVPEILEPFLFYILHRAQAAIHDTELATTFKVFVLDEAWRFLRHPTIKLYVQEALKTWRKKNAAMILVTQSGDDLFRSEMLPVVVESCATKMFLANPGMDRRVYREAFQLNEREAELVAGLVPKQQILLKRPDVAKILNLNVDPRGYWLYTNNPYDTQKKREAFEQYGFDQGLEILARSHPS